MGRDVFASLSLLAVVCYSLLFPSGLYNDVVRKCGIVIILFSNYALLNFLLVVH